MGVQNVEFNAEGHPICNMCRAAVFPLPCGPKSQNYGKLYYKCAPCDNWLWWQDQVDRFRAILNVPEPIATQQLTASQPQASAVPSVPAAQAPAVSPAPAPAPATPTVARSRSQPIVGTQPSSQPTPSRTRTLHANLSDTRTTIQPHLSRASIAARAAPTPAVAPAAAPATPSRRVPSPQAELEVDRGATTADEAEVELHLHATDDEFQSIDLVHRPARTPERPQGRSNDRTPTSTRKKQRMPGAFTASTDSSSSRSVASHTVHINAWRTDTARIDDGDVFGPTQDTLPAAAPLVSSTPTASPSRAGTVAGTISTASRMHGLLPSVVGPPSSPTASVATVRLSEPVPSPSEAYSVEDRLDAITKEFKALKLHFSEQARRAERAEREKRALHAQCEQFERELGELRRRNAQLESQVA